MNRAVKILLAFILSCPLLLFTVTGSFAKSGVQLVCSWDISESETDSVTASLYDTEDSGFILIIEGEGSMRSFSVSSPVPWFSYAEGITSASIGKGVTNISAGVLTDCVKLELLIIENREALISLNYEITGYKTKIYGHGISTAYQYVFENYPERFYYICDFEDSVCTDCGFECSSHIGAPECEKYAVCEICGAEFGELGEHQYSALNAEIPSDCFNDGVLAHYSCLTCGMLFDTDFNKTDAESLEIIASHSFGELKEYKPASCSELGILAHYSCSVCGGDFDESGNALTDVYIPVTEHYGGEATCTERAVCSLCKKPYGEVAPDNHIYSEQYSFNESSHWLECICGNKSGESVHGYEERILKPATETEEGIKEYFCICGKTIETRIPVLSTGGNEDIGTDDAVTDENTYEPNTEDEPNVLLIVFAVLAGAAVLCFGTILVFIFIKRKLRKQCH